MRGVSRPQMDQGQQGNHHEHGKEGGHAGHGPGAMTPEQRMDMLQNHHQQTLWAPCAVVALGFWLLSSPFTFGYAFDAAMMINDLVTAAVLVVFGVAWAKTPQHPTVPWILCAAGVWLQFAPLVFWAETPAAYLTDTFVGAWVIALTILIPGMPHMIMMMKMGPEVPPGWSYNPSSWAQRAPLVVTAIAGWFISRYLAAYQLGYIGSAWDPFFGGSTQQVLASKVSRAWPISDAGLGAFAYTFEALMAFMGGVQRWRTMPWMVTFFGILVIPLGLVHIVLVILQPVVVGHWCTLCLAAAAIMLIMIPLAVDEVVAMCQFLRRSLRQGQPFWITFWKGGTLEGEGDGKDGRSPAVNGKMSNVVPAGFWGMSFPWTLLASAAVGLWLMSSPALLGISGRVAAANQVLGAVALTIAVIAMAEVIRASRYLNAPVGLLAAFAWILAQDASPMLLWHNLVAGFALLILAIPRGPIREQYGTWMEYVR